LRRIGQVSSERGYVLFRNFFFALMVATIAFHFSGLPTQTLVGVLALGIIYTEFRARRKIIYPMKNFIISVGFLALAFTCSMLDLSGIYCDPTNHWIQGHALWHVFGAASFIFSFRHYESFRDELEIVKP